MYDLIIKNGRIIDGTRGPWFRNDIGVKDGKIIAIQHLESGQGDSVIDATSKYVMPGFIDIHTHSDFVIFSHPDMITKLKQGVTSMLMGACGISAAPVHEDKIDLLDKYAGFVRAGEELDYQLRSFADYLELLEQLPLGIHVGGFVGQGTIRLNQMGFSDRSPTPEDIERMQEMLDEALSSGAFGLTTGLIYPPGSYSGESEIIELSSVLTKHNAVYLSHMRNESFDLINSIQEILRVGKVNKIPVQIHHLKAMGKENWGTVKEALRIVEEARSSGVDVTIDQYPYTVASTTLRACLPPWVHEGGVDAMIQRLENTQLRKKIIEEIYNTEDWDNLYKFSGGAEGIYILYAPETPSCEGKTVAELTADDSDPVEIICDILVKNRGQDMANYALMSEDDVEQVMKSKYTMIASDSIFSAPGTKSHPRTYSTFPRVLSEYAKEKKALSMEEAVAKMTSFPAARFGIEGKGLLKEGMDADIVVMDGERIQGWADFNDPYREPEGIDHVIVGGVEVIRNKEDTGARNGTVLKKRG